eukprot:g2749.t1
MKELKFAYPAALSSLGQLTSAVVVALLVHVFGAVELKHRASMTRGFYCARVVPIAVFTASTFFTGNMVYLYLGVGLIQMLKAFTPVVVLAMSVAAGMASPTCALIGATFTICVGVVMSSHGALAESEPQIVFGLAVAMASQVAEAARLLLMQRLIKGSGGLGTKLGVSEGLYWMCPAVVLTTWLVVVPLAELGQMRHGSALSIIAAHPTDFALAMALGFAVNFAGFFVISTSNALVLKLLGMLRNLLLVGCSSMLMGENISAQQLSGFAVALCGFGYFQYLQMNGLANLPSSKEQVHVRHRRNYTYR